MGGPAFRANVGGLTWGLSMTLSKKNRAQLESFDEESVSAALEELDTLQGQLDNAHEHITTLEGQLKDAKAKLADVEKQLANPPPPPPTAAAPKNEAYDAIVAAAAFVAWQEQVGEGHTGDWDSTEYEKTVWKQDRIKKMHDGIDKVLHPKEPETEPKVE